MITPAPLTIAADNQTKVYGAALPALTASYDGLVNDETPTSLATPPTLTTTATASSPVVAGGYSITASAAVDPNYVITYAAGDAHDHPGQADDFGLRAGWHVRHQPLRRHRHIERHGQRHQARCYPGKRQSRS